MSSGILAARPALGVSAMLANTLIVPVMAVAIRYLAEDGSSTVEMLAWRSFLALALLLLLLPWPGNWRAILTADRKAHLLHAVFTLSSMTCFYYALRTMPIATVTAINFIAPIMALILARLLFDDRLDGASWLAAGSGFAGTLLVLQPDPSALQPEAIVVLLGASISAGTLLIVRRMPARSSNYAIVFYLSGFGALAFGLIYLPAARLPPLPSWPWLAVLGVTALAIHTLMAIAFRLASSMLVGALDYVRLIWALGVGYLLFAERPGLIEAAGMILVVASGLYILYRETGTSRTPGAV